MFSEKLDRGVFIAYHLMVVLLTQVLAIAAFFANLATIAKLLELVIFAPLLLLLFPNANPKENWLTYVLSAVIASLLASGIFFGLLLWAASKLPNLG